MLFKTKDPADKAIQELETIAHLPSFSNDVLAKVEKELKTLKAGDQGESNSAYFIDFYYREKPNWAIIHDLRIEYGGNVAQIDHLLITRFLEFYVLESKSYAYGLKITDRGEFMFWGGHRYIAMESPIEQVRRHAVVLEQLLRGEGLLPKRLGVVLPPALKPFVLVSPKSRVIRPDRLSFNSDIVIKSDDLFRQLQADFDVASTAYMVGALAKLISIETLTELAQRLITYHKPTSIDYYAKFNIKPIQPVQAQATKSKAKNGDEGSKPQSKYFCFKCKKPITQRVATFCFQHKERFSGKVYCFNCQKAF